MRTLFLVGWFVLLATGCNGQKIEGATARCHDQVNSAKNKDFMCKQCCREDLGVDKVDNGTGKMQGDKCVCAIE